MHLELSEDVRAEVNKFWSCSYIDGSVGLGEV